MARGSKNTFGIVVKNCRNIKRLEDDAIYFKNSHINILFGRNGTGKTTLAKALATLDNRANANARDELKSYEALVTNDPALYPEVFPTSKRKFAVMLFDENWVSDHCFLPDGNLQSDAYRLYVSSKEIRRLEQQRDTLLSALRSEVNSEDSSLFISRAHALVKEVGWRKNGQFTKAFVGGGPMKDLSGSLRSVASQFGMEKQTLWLQWHIDGAPFLGEKQTLCPYCGERSSNLDDVRAFDKAHTALQGKAWSRVVEAIVGDTLLGKGSRRRALRIASTRDPLSEGDRAWVLQTIKNVDELAKCVAGLRQVVDTYANNSNDMFFKEIAAAADVLENARGLSEETLALLKRIHKCIKNLRKNEGKLRKAVKQLETQAVKNTTLHQSEINDLLKECGYPYRVVIQGDISRADARVLLVSDAITAHVDNAKEALSYGEANALSLIMFMFEALAAPENTVIVIDDPISSFDGDKRFALLYRMFHNFKKPKYNLFGRTVIMLTHSYPLITDMMRVLNRRFSKLNAQYLETRHGILRARPITTDEVHPYSQMLESRINACEGRDPFFALVYLRCLCELKRTSPTDRKTREGCAFNVISEILHMRDYASVMQRLRGRSKSEVPRAVQVGEAYIAGRIDGFTLVNMLKAIREPAYIRSLYDDARSVPYEKLQVLRLLGEGLGQLPENAALTRYANESNHLAGDYLYQLDPVDFNPVPAFVEEWCDAQFEKMITEYERVYVA